MTTIPMLEKELEQAYKDLNYYKNRNEKFKTQLQQKENIIKEVREYFENHTFDYDDLMLIKPSDVLEILDKVEE